MDAAIWWLVAIVALCYVGHIVPKLFRGYVELSKAADRKGSIPMDDMYYRQKAQGRR